MNSTSIKPMTIKEYKKNYYKIHKMQGSDIDNNLNQSQSILFYKILKNKKLHGHILDSNANKTTQTIYQKEENRKKVLKILKKKNYEIANTSRVSPNKKKDSGESPTFFTGNNAKSSKLKKNEDSPFNISDYKTLYDRNTINKSNKDILTDSFLTNKNYNGLTATASRKHIKSYKALTPLVNERNNKIFKDGKEGKTYGYKNKKYEAAYKNKDNSRLYSHLNHNHYQSQKELSPISINKKLKYTKKAPANLNFNNNTKKIDNTKVKNNYLSTTNTTRAKMNEKIIYHKNNNNNNNPKNGNYHFNSSNIINEKEFNNLQKKNVELFTIKNFIIKEDKSKEPVKEENIPNPLFKNLKKDQCINFTFRNQSKAKASNKDKDKVKGKKANINNDQYTGYVLLKKNKGNVEEETKIENDIENIKTIFLNLINNISDDQLEFITTSELTSLKSEINENINIINDLEKEKKENLLKADKIREQEEIIQKKEEEYFEYQKEYLKLQSEFEQLKTESDKMKEKINLMEKENKKILEDNSKLKEEYAKYKNTKDEKMDNEIKDLEGKIKKYKEELKKSNNNSIKNNFNMGDINSKTKRMSFSYNYKFDSLLKNLEKKKNENNKKVINANSKSSKLVVIDEKKILEDNEDKEDIEEQKDEKEKPEEEAKVNETNNINNENNIIKENNEINENKLQQPIINNDSSSHISKNEIELNMANNVNNIQLIPKNNISTINDINNTNNEVNNVNKNSNTSKANDEKGKKMSKALNRFRKKMSQAQPNVPSKNYKNEKNNERSNSCAKRSEKISGIARMLEQQMGRRDVKFEVNEENRAATDDETDRELDIVKLIEKKPTYGGRKRKPTLKIKFSKEQLDD